MPVKSKSNQRFIDMVANHNKSSVGAGTGKPFGGKAAPPFHKKQAAPGGRAAAVLSALTKLLKTNMTRPGAWRTPRPPVVPPVPMAPTLGNAARMAGKALAGGTASLSPAAKATAIGVPLAGAAAYGAGHAGKAIGNAATSSAPAGPDNPKHPEGVPMGQSRYTPPTAPTAPPSTAADEEVQLRWPKGRPDTSGPPGMWDKAKTWVGENKLPLGIAGGIAAGGGLMALLERKRRKQEEEDAGDLQPKLAAVHRRIKLAKVRRHVKLASVRHAVKQASMQRIKQADNNSVGTIQSLKDAFKNVRQDEVDARTFNRLGPPKAPPAPPTPIFDNNVSYPQSLMDAFKGVNQSQVDERMFRRLSPQKAPATRPGPPAPIFDNNVGYMRSLQDAFKNVDQSEVDARTFSRLGPQKAPPAALAPPAPIFDNNVGYTQSLKDAFKNVRQDEVDARTFSRLGPPKAPPAPPAPPAPSFDNNVSTIQALKDAFRNVDQSEVDARMFSRLGPPKAPPAPPAPIHDNSVSVADTVSGKYRNPAEADKTVFDELLKQPGYKRVVPMGTDRQPARPDDEATVGPRTHERSPDDEVTVGPRTHERSPDDEAPQASKAPIDAAAATAAAAEQAARRADETGDGQSLYNNPLPDAGKSHVTISPTTTTNTPAEPPPAEPSWMDNLKGLNPAILSGGLGALAGGAYGALAPGEEEDENGRKRKRNRLVQSLLYGGLGAAGAAGAGYGGDALAKYLASRKA